MCPALWDQVRPHGGAHPLLPLRVEVVQGQDLGLLSECLTQHLHGGGVAGPEECAQRVDRLIAFVSV